MGIQDRDWYRNERRQQRQQRLAINLQPKPESPVKAPPGFTSVPAIFSFAAGLIVALVAFSFI